ncbi:hypothetical protein DFH28DRAFT_401664 [Melampsora americana]|nr:hypothetical protein DFH28DRAFT_401664 [Melampsora americana]
MRLIQTCFESSSFRSAMFEHSETVQALERILQSQIFEMVSQQAAQDDPNTQHTLQSQVNILSLTDKSLHYNNPKVNSQILNDENFFKAATACLQRQDAREALNTPHHKPSESSNHDHPSHTAHSLQAVSTESANMFIDPRLHVDLSTSDEIVQVDSFKSAKETFTSSEFGPTEQLGLEFEMRMNDGLSTQPDCRGISAEGLPFGLDFSTEFEDSNLPAELEMLLSQDIQSIESPSQTLFSSTALRRNKSPEAVIVNPLKRTQSRSNASRHWIRRPSSSISALLIKDDISKSPCKSRTRYSTSPKGSQSLSTIPDPNVHPLLQGLEFEEGEDLNQMDSSPIKPNRSSRKRARSSTSHKNQSQSSPSDDSEDNDNDPSTPKSLKAKQPEEKVEEISSDSLSNLSQRGIDVHGSGAGGGAAAILESILSSTCTSTTEKKTKHKLPLTSSLLSIYIKRPCDPKSKTHQISKSIESEDDVDVEIPPESYHNPDQFRSFNRIHWTKEEEELLLNEVEMNYQRYDCMSQIMKRHGPNGTVSTRFSDRTGVSLKDKAVNISSRWYRDKTEVSEIRRRAFARFRPKQLRGKLRSELPGMNLLEYSSKVEEKGV